MITSWQIIDDNGVIHEGSEDWMCAAFDYMTHSIETLRMNYPEIDVTDLKASIDKWTRPFTGNLRLIQIHGTFNQQ